MGGMFPILIPLLALKRFSSACHVGLIMAAFNLGGLMAAIWGSVADRYKIHRVLLTSGLIITAIALAALSFTNTFSFWLGLALIQGEQFIGVWFLCVAGASAIYTFYPIMMQEVYGMKQELLSLTFAVAMGLSVFIFATACVTGSAVGGWLAAQWGYTATAGMAVVTEASGLFLMHKISTNR